MLFCCHNGVAAGRMKWVHQVSRLRGHGLGAVKVAMSGVTSFYLNGEQMIPYNLIEYVLFRRDMIESGRLWFLLFSDRLVKASRSLHAVRDYPPVEIVSMFCRM